MHAARRRREVNGARRWIGAGPLQFQPSELLKLALVLYAAKLLAAAPERVRALQGHGAARCWSSSARRALLVAVAARPRHRAGHRASRWRAAVAGGVPLRNLAIARRRRRWCLVVLFALLEPYRRARLTSFLDPWAHAGGSGFQSVQGQIALGSGGLFGVGLGESVQKIFYLPEAHTDFILAVIGEELGVVGVCGVLFLYGMIAYAGLRAAQGGARRLRQAARRGHDLADPLPGDC